MAGWRRRGGARGRLLARAGPGRLRSQTAPERADRRCQLSRHRVVPAPPCPPAPRDGDRASPRRSGENTAGGRDHRRPLLSPQGPARPGPVSGRGVGRAVTRLAEHVALPRPCERAESLRGRGGATQPPLPLQAGGRSGRVWSLPAHAGRGRSVRASRSRPRGSCPLRAAWGGGSSSEEPGRARGPAPAPEGAAGEVPACCRRGCWLEAQPA